MLLWRTSVVLVEDELWKGIAMITSHTNKGIKEVIQLAQKTKARKEKGLFVAEGMKMFLEAPVDEIQKVYVSASLMEQITTACKSKLHSILCHYEIVSDEIFKKMSDTKTPQGILCVMRQKTYSLDAMLMTADPLLLIIEDIQDPGNLGTIFRAPARQRGASRSGQAGARSLSLVKDYRHKHRRRGDSRGGEQCRRDPSGGHHA